MKIFFAAGLLLSLSGAASAQPDASCVEFQALVKKTYNFNLKGLSTQEIVKREKLVDGFWKTVKAGKTKYLPCLRSELNNEKANKLFRFDGANLLVSLDPSTASKQQLIDIYTVTDMDIAGQQRWLVTLAQLGREGFDVSKAATRWLTDPKSYYTQPEHGDFEVTDFIGALFLFGSMSEAKAMPALMAIINNKEHPRREEALAILMDECTPESFKAIDGLDANTFSPAVQNLLQGYKEHPTRIVPREKPLATREEYVVAFQDVLKGKPARFDALVEKFGDGEKDIVAVMKPEDLPLLRQVRRRYISSVTPHALSFYNSFTDIIMTLMLKDKPGAETEAPKVL